MPARLERAPCAGRMCASRMQLLAGANFASVFSCLDDMNTARYLPKQDTIQEATQGCMYLTLLY